MQSSGSAKDTKKTKKNKDQPNSKNRKNDPKPLRVIIPKDKEQIEDGADEDEPTVQADVDMLDALTGIPVVEDELLFAIPVIAPYNTLANYK